VDVRKDTTGRDGDVVQKFVEFLVVSNGELNVSWNDALLVVVSACVAREFKDFRT